MRAARIQKLNALTDRWLPLLILVASVVGGVYSAPWLRAKSWGPYLMAYNMFTVSTGIEWRHVCGVFRRPLLLLVAYALLFIGSPAIGFAIGNLVLRVDSEVAAGLILLGSLPVGAMAAVWSGLEDGNVALSLTLVGVTTLTCGLVTPLVLGLALRKVVAINTVALMTSLLVTVLLPSVGGLVAGNVGNRWMQVCRPYLQLGVRLTTLLMVLANAAALKEGSSSAWNPLIVRTVVVVSSQIVLGCILAYVVSGFLLRSAYEDRISIMFATSMRNNVAGIVLAASYFTPKVALPSVVALLVQQPMAGVVARLIRFRRIPLSTPDEGVTLPGNRKDTRA